MKNKFGWGGYVAFDILRTKGNQVMCNHLLVITCTCIFNTTTLFKKKLLEKGLWQVLRYIKKKGGFPKHTFVCLVPPAIRNCCTCDHARSPFL